MMPRNAKAPTIPIPFHKMLKIVALVDEKNSQTKAFLDEITAANFQIEVSDDYERDVSEDADVGRVHRPGRWRSA